MFEIKADSERLRQTASQLHDGASRLDGVAHSRPPMPEVTTSSEKVSYTLAQVMKATAALMTGVQDTADKIDASDGSYAETDNTNAEDLRQVPKFSR